MFVNNVTLSNRCAFGNSSYLTHRNVNVIKKAVENSSREDNIKFISNQSLSIKHNFEKVLKKYIPILNKRTFTEIDYNMLTEAEKLIFRKILSKKDISIKKDSKIIFKTATKLKKYLDNKYPKGYKLVSIGNSPAPFTETMKLMGADTVTIPFSADIFYKKLLKIFCNTDYTNSDWENYFKHFGIKKDASSTNKKIIFTDFEVTGTTLKYFQDILNNQNIENTEIISFTRLLHLAKIKTYDYSKIKHLLMTCQLKYLTEKFSLKHFISASVDVIKKPHNIDIIGERFASKLLKFHFFDKKNGSFIDKIKTFIKLPFIKI